MNNLVLQDIVLNSCRREKQEVKILLITGKTIIGNVRGFDSHAVIVDDNEGVQVMIYKNSISTITLERPVLVDNYKQES